MVGRSVELDRLKEALELAADGHTRTVALFGEAGIGKTRLLREFGVYARGVAATTLVGAGLPLSAPPPYGPWIDAFRHERRAASHSSAEDDAAVDELLQRLEGGGDDSTDAETRRGRLLGALRRAVEHLRDAGPLVIVVDDAQWLDQGSSDLIGYLHAQHQLGVLILLAVRIDEAIPSGVARLLGELQRSDRHDRLELEPLTPSNVLQQIGAIRSDVDRAALDRIVSRADGNPLFVEVLTADPSQGESFGGTIREIALERIRRLSPSSQRIVTRLAAVGARCDFDLLVRITDQTPEDVIGALREATQLGVTRPRFDDERETYDFRHAIFREAAYAELLPGERSELHASIARALAADDDGTDRAGIQPGPWALLAHHWDRAHDSSRALAAHIEAAALAKGGAAYGDALRHLARAVDLWAAVDAQERPQSISLAEVRESEAECASAAGEPRRAIEAQEAAIGHAITDGVSDGAIAQMHLRLARYAWEAGDDAAAEAAHDEAVRRSASASPDVRAVVLAGDASQLMVRAKFSAALKRARQAYRAAQQAGARGAEGAALAVMGVAKVNLGKFDEGIEDLQGARLIADETRSPDDLRRSYVNLVGSLVRAGRREDAIDVGRNGMRLADELGLDQSFGALLAANLTVAMFEAGRWDEAWELGERMLERNRQTLAAMYLALVMASIGIHRGKWDEARSYLAIADEVARGSQDPTLTASLMAVAAELAMADGRLSDANAIVGQALERLAASDEWLATATLVTVGLRALVAYHRKAVGGRALEAGQTAAHYARVLDAIPAPTEADRDLDAELETARALAVTLEGGDAATRWRAAVERWAVADQPFRLASARFELAYALLTKRASRSEAEAQIRMVAASASELGAQPLSEQVELLARRTRISLDLPPAPEAEHAVVEEARALGLSARETEVLELVARGLTNRQIADTLFISEKTASVHVSNILGKLGVRSRVEAAGVAFESGMGTRPSSDSGEQEPSPGTASRPGRMTLALMFTDIAHSTELVDAIGDAAWLQLQRWHEATLRSLFADYAGVEVDHAGDGFFVVFPSAPAAIRCAIAIQRALDHHRRTSGFAPEIRIGIHRAEVERDGNAYRGRGVHEASRIASAAAPSEILASILSLAGVPARYRTVTDSRDLQAAGLRTPIAVASIAWR